MASQQHLDWDVIQELGTIFSRQVHIKLIISVGITIFIQRDVEAWRDVSWDSHR